VLEVETSNSVASLIIASSRAQTRNHLWKVLVTWCEWSFGDPNYTFGTAEARHFKFGVLIKTEEYLCNHDRLPPPRWGCIQGQLTSLKMICNDLLPTWLKVIS